MKNKNLFTFALVFVGFLALCGVIAIETQLSAQLPVPELPTQLSANIVAPPISSEQPLETMGDKPRDATRIDTTREARYSTLLAAPTGCTIDQDTLEEWHTNLNIIFNNAITVASIMRGVSDNPHTTKFPDIAVLLQNNIMPQDVERTCKALQEKLAYLAQLTTAIKTNIYTAIPTNMP